MRKVSLSDDADAFPDFATRLYWAVAFRMVIDAFCSVGAETVPSIYCHRGPAGECVVMVAIDAKLLQLDAETPSVELHWNGISVHVSTTDGFITASQHGTGKWCWISGSLPFAAVPGNCGIVVHRGRQVIASGEIHVRDHVPLRNVRRSGSLPNRILGEFLLRTARPVLNIHFWHEDVAREIAALPAAAHSHFEIRLLTPENVDPHTVENFVNHLRATLRFRRISRLIVPARGRDIGGLVGLLQADARNDAMAMRPQLFTHTKKTCYLPPQAQADWRRGLLSSLATGGNLRCAIRQLFFPRTAMVCAGERACLEPFPGIDGPRQQSLELAGSLAERLFGRRPPEFTFSAGTMFWLRSDRTAKVWTAEKLQYVASRLEPSESLTEPSHAHAFERLFPAAVADSGFRVSLM